MLGLLFTVVVVADVLSSPAPVATIENDRVSYVEPAPGEDPVEHAAQTEQGAAYAPADPVPGQPLRLAIPAVGIDATVGAMSVPSDREVDPPTPGSAYWLRDYSVLGAAAAGTGYIAGHTHRGSGSAVFNPLFDPKTREARIHPDDVVEITTPDGVSRYRVTAVQNFDKRSVPDEADVWQDVPGRLVLVACWYNGSQPATANMVVYAEIVTP